MRQFLKLGLPLLWSFGVTLVDAKLQAYDDRDSRIEWTPSDVLTVLQCGRNPDNQDCRGRWWTEGGGGDYRGTVTDTLGPNTSMRFSFRGAAIAIYGVRLDNGAFGTVTVDGEPRGSFNCSSPDGSLRRQTELFALDGLDPNLVHSVVVAYDPLGNTITGKNNLWLGIDYILVDESDETSSGDSASSKLEQTSPATAPASTAPTSGLTQPKRLSTGELAGIAIGVFVLVAGICLLVYLWYRRSRARQQRRIYRGKLDTITATSSQSVSGPPTHRTGVASVDLDQGHDGTEPEPFMLHLKSRAEARPPSYTKR